MSFLPESTELIQQLLARVQRLEDTIEIQKLQSKYAHLLFKLDVDRIMDECIAKRAEDVTLEFSDSGVYRGREKIRQVYQDFGAARQVPGFFILHMTVNPYIEIAQDGLTAKSHWLSPGAVGSDTSARWVWGPYYIDYVKEDGQWKILHSNLAALFRNPYEKSWAESSDHGTVTAVLTDRPDAPPTLYRPYNELKKQTDIFKHHPQLPQPY
jgi:ketosteroid isomerase-like protein